jgi:hypothetical protein
MNYFKNILIGLDQGVGTLFGIPNDETISSYAYRTKKKWLITTIDFMFGKGHCKNSLEDHTNCGGTK